MRAKYWAKNKYSQVDPVEYALQRFSTPAGKLIDEVEKNAVLDLLLSSGITQKKELKILDVATGPGRLSFFLEEHLRNAEITGVDINENMLDRAREIAKDNKSKIHFMKGDIYNLPFKESQFDAVMGLRFSMHLPEIDKSIKEFSRVLQKGGILIFEIFNYHSILQLRLMNPHNKKTDCGFYTIGEITRIVKNYNFEPLGYKGIFLFGETIIRKFPRKYIRYLNILNNLPSFLENISSKLVLSFFKEND